MTFLALVFKRSDFGDLLDTITIQCGFGVILKKGASFSPGFEERLVGIEITKKLR
jgi:hypothetical protein